MTTALIPAIERKTCPAVEVQNRVDYCDCLYCCLVEGKIELEFNGYEYIEVSYA